MSFLKRLAPGESYDITTTSSTSTHQKVEGSSSVAGDDFVPSQGISGHFSKDYTELGSLPNLVTPQPFSNRQLEYRSISSSIATVSRTSTSPSSHFRDSVEKSSTEPPTPTKRTFPPAENVNMAEEPASGPFPPASASTTPRLNSVRLQAQWGFVEAPKFEDIQRTETEEKYARSNATHQRHVSAQESRERVIPVRMEGRNDESETVNTMNRRFLAQKHFQSANPVQTWKTVPSTAFVSPDEPKPTVRVPAGMMVHRHPHHQQEPSDAYLQGVQDMVECPSSVKLYEAAITGPLEEFLNLSSEIGGDLQETVGLLKGAFGAQKEFLWRSAGMLKPSDADLMALLKPTSDKIMEIQEMKNAKRQSPFFNHLSTISEGIPALGWVTVAPTPAPFIKEMIDASQFYTNRVLKDFKEKDKKHVDWVKAWLQTLNELHQFVKQNFTTGLTWNSVPGAVAPSGGVYGVGGAPAPPGSGPPPPPPLPPADLFKDLNKGSQPSGQDDARSALFADINKGDDVTKNLKKVTDDMKTHKNPALRRQEPVPDKKPVVAPKPAHLVNGAPSPPTKPAPKPVCELQGGKKWMVEYQKSNPSIVIEAENMKQVVYIFKCENTVVQIKGKINSVTLDSCKKTSVVFDDLVASVEVINCQSAQVQTFGKLPTLTIQKTDGCQVYLSRESLNAEVVTSKSSEMNILVPDENGEFHEFVVPEQFKTVWTGKELKTTVVDLG